MGSKNPFSFSAMLKPFDFSGYPEPQFASVYEKRLTVSMCMDVNRNRYDDDLVNRTVEKYWEQEEFRNEYEYKLALWYEVNALDRRLFRECEKGAAFVDAVTDDQWLERLQGMNE